MTNGADKSPSSRTTDAPKSGAARPLDRVGGRKYTLVIGASLVYTLLLIGGYLDQSVYASLQMVTVGAFIAGNVAAHFAEKPNVDRTTQ